MKRQPDRKVGLFCSVCGCNYGSHRRAGQTCGDRSGGTNTKERPCVGVLALEPYTEDVRSRQLRSMIEHKTPQMKPATPRGHMASIGHRQYAEVTADDGLAIVCQQKMVPSRVDVSAADLPALFEIVCEGLPESVISDLWAKCYDRLFGRSDAQCAELTAMLDAEDAAKPLGESPF